MLSEIKTDYDSIIGKFSQTSSHKKKELLDMAKKGTARPDYRSKEYTYLRSYTNKHSKAYDKNFDKEIRRLAPRWFITRTEKNKKKLIEAIKKGGPKPKYGSKLYTLLLAHTSKNKSYDQKIENLVKEKVPHWLFSRSDRKTIKKQSLISLIRSDNTKKPNRSTELGRSLKNFICKSSYIFDQEVLDLVVKHKPEWI